MTKATREPDADEVLWEVVEDHLEELEFCVEHFERTLDDPRQDLSRLATGIERRMLAHVDGLVVGGDVVRAQTLEPAVAEIGPEEPVRATALGFALAAGGHFDLLAAGFASESSEVRRGFVRGATLVNSAAMQTWVWERLRSAALATEQAAFISVLAREGVGASLIAWALRHDEVGIAAAGARAARYGDATAVVADIERLIESTDSVVRDEALVTALALGSSSAWIACEELALAETVHPLAMTLYASLGAPYQQERLARQVTRTGHRPHALFALGFSGNPGLVPLLLEHVSSDNLIEAKIASQSISTIAGFDLTDSRLARETEMTKAVEDDASSLPDLEDEPEDLIPPPEETLPAPEPGAFVKLWGEVRGTFKDGTRYLDGRPFEPRMVLDYLERAPLRRRHALVLALGIRSAGRTWIDSRALSRTQRAQLAEAQTTDASTLLRRFA